MVPVSSCSYVRIPGNWILDLVYCHKRNVSYRWEYSEKVVPLGLWQFANKIFNLSLKKNFLAPEQPGWEVQRVPGPPRTRGHILQHSHHTGTWNYLHLPLKESWNSPGRIQQASEGYFQFIYTYITLYMIYNIHSLYYYILYDIYDI